MADPRDPKRSPVPGPQGQPLPRLWKHPQNEDPADAPGGKKKKRLKEAADEEPAKPGANSREKDRAADTVKPGKKKAATSEKGGDKGPKSALVEETPTFDTYEARQRARILVGLAGTAFLAVALFLVWRQFAPESPPDDGVPADMYTASGSSTDPRIRDEQEARILLDRAKEVAKNGKVEIAVALLKRVSTKYPTTTASNEAKEALERPKQGLPLFPDRPAVVASEVDKPASASPAPGAVVDATKTIAPAANANGNANLVLPANPGEVSAATNPAARPMKPLPSGFRPREGTDVHPSGWPLEIVADRDGAPMLFVAGDTFLQGRDDGDPAESPVHRVTLGSFYIDKHEVTVRQFNLFQREQGKRSERVRALAREASLATIDQDEDKPVVMVSARDAADYASWTAKKMPTEAQWEAAARTPDGRAYPWGPEPPSGDKTRDLKQVSAVMTNAADVSPYGVFDLAGNAAEWTKDWYEPKYYQAFRSVAADNPLGPPKPKSQQLVVKGSGRDWIVTRREGVKSDARLPYLGFRCVLQVEGPGNAFEPPPAPASNPTAPRNSGTNPGGSAVPF